MSANPDFASPAEVASVGITVPDHIPLRSVVDHRLLMDDGLQESSQEAAFRLLTSDPRDVPTYREAATRSLRGATWWATESIAGLVDHAAGSMPAHALEAEAVPDPNGGVVLFERPLTGVDTERPGEVVSVHAISWCGGTVAWRSSVQGVLFVFDWCLYEARRRQVWGVLGGGWWRLGQQSDESDDDDDNPLHVASAVEDRHRLSALWSIADTPRLALSEDIAPPRASRRRAERADRPVPTIRVIDARRSGRGGGDGSESTAWSHRWIVGGHWRQQSYGPGQTQRRPTWIAPYVKGPDDKPLVVKDDVRVIR